VILEHNGGGEEGEGMMLKNVVGSRSRQAWDTRKVAEKLGTCLNPRSVISLLCDLGQVT
jgi:hypothetical protein